METKTPFGITVKTELIQIRRHDYLGYKLLTTAANWSAEYLLMDYEVDDPDIYELIHKTHVKQFLKYAVTANLC